LLSLDIRCSIGTWLYLTAERQVYSVTLISCTLWQTWFHCKDITGANARCQGKCDIVLCLNSMNAAMGSIHNLVTSQVVRSKVLILYFLVQFLTWIICHWKSHRNIQVGRLMMSSLKSCLFWWHIQAKCLEKNSMWCESWFHTSSVKCPTYREKKDHRWDSRGCGFKSHLGCFFWFFVVIRHQVQHMVPDCISQLKDNYILSHSFLVHSGKPDSTAKTLQVQMQDGMGNQVRPTLSQTKTTSCFQEASGHFQRLSRIWWSLGAIGNYSKTNLVKSCLSWDA